MGTYRNSITSWFCRHRNKFITAGVVVGGVYGGIKYTEYRVKKFFEDQQQRMMDEMKQQRSFEKAQAHCSNIILPILKTYEGMLASSVDIAAIKMQLKNKSGNKVALWNQLKLAIFTKLCSSLLWVIVIVIVIKVQFNQIASLIFIKNKCENPTSSEDDEMEGVVDEDHQVFLSLSQTMLMADNTAKLTADMEGCVADILQTMPLQCPVGSSTIDTTLHSIFHNFQNTFLDVDNNMMIELLTSCFPASLFDNTYPNKTVQEWANTALDILDSPDCEAVFVECLHIGLDYLKNDLHSLMGEDGSPSDNIKNTIPLAKSLPLINSLSEEIFSERFIENLLSCPSLHEFSANIFQSFLSKS